MSYGMQKDRQLPLSGLIDKSHDKQKNSHILHYEKWSPRIAPWWPMAFNSKEKKPGETHLDERSLSRLQPLNHISDTADDLSHILGQRLTGGNNYVLPCNIGLKAFRIHILLVGIAKLFIQFQNLRLIEAFFLC